MGVDPHAIRALLMGQAGVGRRLPFTFHTEIAENDRLDVMISKLCRAE